MRASLTALCVPKAGNRPDETEDALFPGVTGSWTGSVLRVAVADGASETLLSGPWAAVLARSYARVAPSADDGELAALLSRAWSRWGRWRRWYLRRRRATGRPVQWFEEPGLAAGAFAALVGLTLAEGEAGGDWSALALGDSCLFQVRADRPVVAFPVIRAADFGVRPFLIGSRDSAAGSVLDAFRDAAGRWRPGDRFYLMTDALAQWWLAECEAGRAPWRPLDRLCTPGRRRAFPQWIATRRRRHDMKNDDVTLLRVALRTEPQCPGRN